MSGADEQSSRIVIGTDFLHLLTVIVLLLCIPLAIIFAMGAVKRPEEPVWWLLTGVIVVIAAYVCWRDIKSKDDWDRNSYLEIQGGGINFVPSREKSRLGYPSAKAPFPEGATLEYRRETGDHYFTGDHGDYVGGSLWIVGQSGEKQKLLDSIGVFARTMVLNLNQAGIQCRAINIYNGQDGEHTETDITAQYAESARCKESPFWGVLLGTSSMWLGGIAAILIRDSGYVIGIGVPGIHCLRRNSNSYVALETISSCGFAGDNSELRRWIRLRGDRRLVHFQIVCHSAYASRRESL
jgi:hypothetical protein